MKNICVIGAGTMGNGIAHVFALHGHSVSLVDVSQKQLDTAIKNIQRNLDRQVAKGTVTPEIKEKSLKNIILHTSLETGLKESDLVIEAATENIEVKMNIFKKIDEYAPDSCILATNTSSISITAIASVTRRPGKVIGMHFMNPVPLMKLVEIINGYETEKEVTESIIQLSRDLDKFPCVVNDYPGFIANRILMPMINEAIYSLYEGVAKIEEIDAILKLGMGHPMGPLQLADFIGLDVCLSILQVLHEGFGNPKYAPCPLLVNMVNAKKTGIKAGEGFYIYSSDSKPLIVSPRFSA